MVCPHCGIGIHDDRKTDTKAAEHDAGSYFVVSRICPVCDQVIVELRFEPQKMAGNQSPNLLHAIGDAILSQQGWTRLIWPKGIGRKAPPPEVPDEFASDYREAALVLADSPNASAALSRRCLQHILREKLKVKPSRPFLSYEIKEVLKDSTTPSYISEALDHLREFGNFAAHPDVDSNTGVVVPVEQGEAEWCLEVLDMVFEFYFVRPAKEMEMQRAIDLRKGKS